MGSALGRLLGRSSTAAGYTGRVATARRPNEPATGRPLVEAILRNLRSRLCMNS